MAKVYSKSISVQRGIRKPKLIVNTNLEREPTVEAPKKRSTVTTTTKRGCGCGRKNK